MKGDIDLDIDSEIPEKPLTGRKHISILIGAGFSAPQGYPIGNTLNENILNFEKYNVNAARKSKVDDNTAKMQSIKQLGV